MRRAIYLVLLFSVNNLSAIEAHFFNPFKVTKYISYTNFAYDGDWSRYNIINPQAAIKEVYSSSDLKFTSIYHSIFSFKALLKDGKDADIVVLHRNAGGLNSFINDVLDHSDKKFILVSISDDTFPYECEGAEKILKALEDGRIIHFFSTNADLEQCPQNVSLIPLGIHYHRLLLDPMRVGHKIPKTPREVDREFRAIHRELLPTNKRSIRPFCDFAIHNTSKGRVDTFGEDRLDVQRKLLEGGMCDFIDRKMPLLELLREKGKRAFDVSPPGVGMDCYRTWEGLIMGCIVIVKTSFLDPLYEGLPVVIVNDWDEITEENLKKWLAEYGDVFHNPEVREKLTHEYWMKKIKKVQSEYREKNA